MFHRTICLTYKPDTAQADADGLLAAFAALPSQVRGLEKRLRHRAAGGL